MENTPLNKVKFFSQHWGQNVFVNPILDPRPVNNIYLFDYAEPEDIDDEYLELKPISLITYDELGTMARFYEPTATNVYLDSEQLTFDYYHGDETHSTAIYLDSGYCLDFLRSKGYATEYMGLSIEKLQEYGWIKLKTD